MTNVRSASSAPMDMALGSRTLSFDSAVVAIFDEDFANRTLPFDNHAADDYADIAATRRAKGAPISQFDAMIAAVVRSRDAALATRNVKDFTGCGIDVIAPWSALVP